MSVRDKHSGACKGTLVVVRLESESNVTLRQVHKLDLNAWTGVAHDHFSWA